MTCQDLNKPGSIPCSRSPKKKSLCFDYFYWIRLEFPYVNEIIWQVCMVEPDVRNMQVHVCTNFVLNVKNAKFGFNLVTQNSCSCFIPVYYVL